MAGDVVVSGATGLVGSRLAAALEDAGSRVRGLSRREGAPFRWDGQQAEPDLLRGADAVVHLSGAPIFAGRLTKARRRRIYASRIDSARSIATALGSLPAEERPDTLVCASAVGYYGARGDEVLDESAAPGEGFLARLCVDWEAATREASRHGVRVVSLRMGVVLAGEGGALPVMALPFRLGLGARLGDGRQWFPWIHVDDLVGLIRKALSQERFRGAVNAVAPAAVTNADLTRALGRVLRRPARLRVPAVAVRAALGELAGELLHSRRVVPAAAQRHGFVFRLGELDRALASVFGER